jgi:hypothetical protein
MPGMSSKPGIIEPLVMVVGAAVAVPDAVSHRRRQVEYHVGDAGRYD